LPLASVTAHEHRQQLVAVKPICLGATRTAVHLDTGRIHRWIDDALFKSANGAARYSRGLLNDS
jgi:hypothetical protein